MKSNKKQRIVVAVILAAVSTGNVTIAYAQQAGGTGTTGNTATAGTTRRNTGMAGNGVASNSNLSGANQPGRDTTIGTGMNGNTGSTWSDTRSQWNNQLSGLNDNDWRSLHNRLYGLSNTERQSWFTTMSRMSPAERAAFMRALNNNSPYGTYRYGQSPGNFNSWSQGVASGIDPGDRPAFTAWMGRLSEPERTTFQRVWDTSNRNAAAWYGLSNEDQTSLNQALGNLSSGDMAVAMNMLQRMTPAEKEVFLRMASGNSMQQGMSTSETTSR